MQNKLRRSQLALLVIFFLAALFVPASTAVYADYFPDDFPSPDAEHLKKLEEILASSDFGSVREGWGIRLRSGIEE